VGYAALAAGIWFLIGVGPAVWGSPPLLTVMLGVMLLTAMLTILPRVSADRRFERSTLRLLLPVFGLYLLLLTFFFPFLPLDTWHFVFGFTDRVKDTSLQFLYSRVEHLAAFTVLGYAIAEWRGRLERSVREDLPHLIIILTSFALILEFLSGFQSGRSASLVRLLLSITGGLFGGAIYHMSRAHIRFLLGR
jgi:hypothetical protein